VAHFGTAVQQVAVLENTPPVAFRDSDGRLTGFSVEAAAVWAEMKTRCGFQAMARDRMVGAQAGGELGAPIDAGRHLQRKSEFKRPGLAATVMTVPDQVGNASFGINPRRPKLKSAVDDARERIKGNRDYERIDTQFLPVRVR
jgi:ABC-type amino acid transport substrate-binding protein